MPSEFDRLKTELRLSDNIAALPFDKLQWVEQQVAQIGTPVTPMAKAAPAWSFDDDGDPYFEVPMPAPVRSAAEVAKSARELRDLTKAAQIGSAQVARIRSSLARDRARDTARAALAKALEAVHAGRMTAHEASVIEARANHIFAKAGVS